MYSYLQRFVRQRTDQRIAKYTYTSCAYITSHMHTSSILQQYSSMHCDWKEAAVWHHRPLCCRPRHRPPIHVYNTRLVYIFIHILHTRDVVHYYLFSVSCVRWLSSSSSSHGRGGESLQCM